MSTGRLRTFVGGVAVFPLGILFGLEVLDQATQSAFNVLIPNVRDAFGLSDAGILAIVAVASAASLLFTVPIAFLADRTVRVRIALLGAALWSCFSIGIGLSVNAWMLGAMLSLTLMGQAVVFPTHNSLLADYYPVSARQRVFSVHRGGLALGAIVGVLVGAGLATAFSWRVPFFFFAVPTFVVVAVGFRLREPPRGHHEQAALAASDPGAGTLDVDLLDLTSSEPPPSMGEAWRLVWKISVLRRLFFALPFLAAAIVGFTSLASLQYQRTFGLDALQRAYIVAPIQVFDILGLVVGARLGTKMAAKDLALAFRLIMYASISAAAFAVLFALAPNVPVAFIGNAGIDASLVIVGPGVLAGLSLAIPARARSLGFSIGALWVLPGLIVIPIIGAIGDKVGFRYGLLLTVPVFLVGGVIVSTAGKLVNGDVRNVWTSVRARAEMLRERKDGKLPLLAVRELSVGYDGVQVLPSLDCEIAEGEIVALLGTNGAGKSTLLRAIGGVVEADGGAVILDGRDITHAPPDEIARLGIAQVPGGDGVFPTLTVEENLRAAAWQDRRDKQLADRRLDEALERFPTLGERRTDRAGDLSGGQQQMLGLAMALLARPKLLLVDELSLGLAPIIVEQLLGSLRAIREQGTAIVLVEQSVNVAVSVADRAYVMEKGEIRFSGSSAELRAHPEVLWSVYLQRAASGVAPAVRVGGPPDAGSPRSEPGRGAVAAGRPERAPGHGSAPPAADAPPAVSVRGVSVAFGGIVALDHVSFDVAPGEVLGVIGPNGAGKTTLIDVISGFTRPAGGQVLLAGRDVTRRGPSGRARLGLGRSFQDSRLFGGLTVRETLAVALERFVDVADPLNAMLRLPAMQRTEAAVAARVDELIAQFGLEQFADKFVSELSTGSRRLVDLAGVLAQAPGVVLLDEPSSGIAQREVEALLDLLERVKSHLSATFVVVEHDIAFVGQFADRLLALDRGLVIAEGPPDDVLAHSDVVEAFLGTDPVTRSRSGAGPSPMEVSVP